MFTSKELTEIANMHTEQPAISLYLNIKTQGINKKEFDIEIKNLFKNYEDLYANKAELKSLITVFEKIAEYIKNRRFDGGLKGVAIFASAEKGIEKVIESNLELRTQLFVDTTFFVHPLAALLDDYEPFVGALIDRKQAKLYYINLGSIEDKSFILDEQKINDRHIDTASKNDIDRKMQEKETAHDRKLAEEIDRFVKKHRVKRLVIGGPKGTLDEFLHTLPKQLEQILAETFHAEIFQQDAAILAQLTDLAVAHERKQEQEKITFIQTSGTKSIRGIEEIINAANKHMIHELVVDFDTPYEGLICESCNMLHTKQVSTSSTCTHCGGHMHLMNDITSHIIKKTLMSGGKVEFVHAPVDMTSISGIGAVLKTK